MAILYENGLSAKSILYQPLVSTSNVYTLVCVKSKIEQNTYLKRQRNI